MVHTAEAVELQGLPGVCCMLCINVYLQGVFRPAGVEQLEELLAIDFKLNPPQVRLGAELQRCIRTRPLATCARASLAHALCSAIR